MREIRTSGSMSGEGKRDVAEWPKSPRLSSTLPLRILLAATFLTRRANHFSDYQKLSGLSSPSRKNILKIVVAYQGKSLP